VANFSDSKRPPLSRLAREATAIVERVWRGFGPLGERGPADGPPLLVIPGFFANDRTTLGLQRALAGAGYRVAGWGLGTNRGARPDILERIAAQVEGHGRGRRVVLVGWSLGGIFAREVAKLRPDLVEMVVTLAAPFSGDPRANNVWRLYELVAGHKVDDPPVEADPSAKPPVPTLALWSRRDGMVAPACARGREGESDCQAEVDCGHMGFAVSGRAYPQIVKAINAFPGG
jgi:pimeloyl-ACP methyl ester carboxylesterase